MENRGATNWALYTDGSNLFAWDLILNTPVRRVLQSLQGASALAVDSNRKYIFILEQREEKLAE